MKSPYVQERIQAHLEAAKRNTAYQQRAEIKRKTESPRPRCVRNGRSFATTWLQDNRRSITQVRSVEQPRDLSSLQNEIMRLKINASEAKSNK